ncbi:MULTISPECIES: hypothetical protein [unclassified Microbacterium]|uniref:hypothetical protein n=1 Tax=unclassified Microbacterium TaxID=2609290 RepID=UPI00214B8703|nr:MULTISPECIES: hypothetical protein [unclassified Microbacterium]MCR2810956.1 hypothetical protein [Microbacterium sp. zg.B185]WIM19645.1 hypothetical protein QNO12_02225 [Microbacterium sp. zg-B185]
MTTWLDDFDSEDLDTDADYDSEDVDFDSEDARSDAARRARAHRLALARRNQMITAQRARSTRRSASALTTPRQTVAAIRSLDLQAKVSADSLQSALARANRRSQRANFSAVAAVGAGQILDSFGSDLAGHEYIRAGLRTAPLLLLTPERKRRGVEGFLLDPRVIGVAGVAAVVAAGKLRHRNQDVASISILEENTTVPGAGTFTGIPRDKSGGVVNGVVPTYRSLNSAVLTVTSDGTFNAVNPGGGAPAFVEATAGGRTQVFRVDT